MDGPHRCPITDDLHVDHILPVKLGGDDRDQNLRTLCATHNLSKGAKFE
jgi:5-methylcytosine-specific restriction endonuclease McrA